MPRRVSLEAALVESAPVISEYGVVGAGGKVCRVERGDLCKRRRVSGPEQADGKVPPGTCRDLIRPQTHTAGAMAQWPPCGRAPSETGAQGRESLFSILPGVKGRGRLAFVAAFVAAFGAAFGGGRRPLHPPRGGALSTLRLLT